MIRLHNHKQQPLFDPWSHMSPKRRQMLDQSWPGLFKELILPELPVSKFKPFFNAGFGRPTKDLYTVMGVLVLQQTHDLNDEETVDHHRISQRKDTIVLEPGGQPHLAMDGVQRFLVELIEVRDLQGDGHSLDRVVGLVDGRECPGPDSASNTVLAEHLPRFEGLAGGAPVGVL